VALTVNDVDCSDIYIYISTNQQTPAEGRAGSVDC